MATNTNRQNLYDILKRDGYDVRDYDSFQKTLANDENMTNLYNTLKRDGYDVRDLPSFKRTLGYGNVGTGVAERVTPFTPFGEDVPERLNVNVPSFSGHQPSFIPEGIGQPMNVDMTEGAARFYKGAQNAARMQANADKIASIATGQTRVYEDKTNPYTPYRIPTSFQQQTPKTATGTYILSEEQKKNLLATTEAKELENAGYGEMEILNLLSKQIDNPNKNVLGAAPNAFPYDDRDGDYINALGEITNKEDIKHDKEIAEIQQNIESLDQQDRDAYFRLMHGKDEDQYIHDEITNRVRSELNDILADKEAREKEQLSQGGVFTDAYLAGKRGVAVDSQTTYDIAKIRQMLRELDLPTRANKEGGAFVKGLKAGWNIYDVLSGGVADVANSINKTKILGKLERGESITDDEYDALRLLELQGQIESIQQSEGGVRGMATAGSVVSENLPFMLQMGAFSGLSKAAGKKITKSILKKGADRYSNKLLNKATEYGAKFLGGLGTAAVQAPLTTIGYDEYNRLTQDQYFNDAGFLNYNKDGSISKYQATPTAQRLFRAGASALIESHSELAFGDFIQKGAGTLTKTLGRKMHLDSMLGKVDRSVVLKTLKERVGWNGTLSEFAEEMYANVLQSAISDDPEQSLRESFSAQNLWVTALSTFMMGGMFSVMETPSIVARETQNVALGVKKRNKLNSINDLDLRKQVFSAIKQPTIERKANAFAGIDWQGVSTPDMMAALDYAKYDIEQQIYRDAVAPTKEEAQFMQAMSVVRDNIYTQNGAQTDDIVIATINGENYYVRSGNLESDQPSELIVIADERGATAQVALGDIQAWRKTAATDYLAEQYALITKKRMDIEEIQDAKDVVTEGQQAGIDEATIQEATMSSIDKLENETAVILNDGRKVFIAGRNNGGYRVVEADENGEYPVGTPAMSTIKYSDIQNVVGEDTAEVNEPVMGTLSEESQEQPDTQDAEVAAEIEEVMTPTAQQEEVMAETYPWGEPLNAQTPPLEDGTPDYDNMGAGEYVRELEKTGLYKTREDLKNALVKNKAKLEIQLAELPEPDIDNAEGIKNAMAMRDTLTRKIGRINNALTLFEDSDIVTSESNIVEQTKQQDNLKSPYYQLSNEIDDNGRQFVLNNHGDIVFGEIEEESTLKAAPILLSEGIITNPATKDGYGLVHIEARHGEQIRKAGYENVVDFIEDIAKNYDVIREGNKRDGIQTYRLQLTDKHNNTLMIELSQDGGYWNINTAGIFKTSYGKKNKVIYNRHTTAKQSSETIETSRNEEQSGTPSSPSMNISTSLVSESKDTKNVPENQTTDEKIAVAEQETDSEPTEAQKEAGNYKKGHLNIDGFNVTIETPKGTTRSGVDESGNAWSITMNNTYGYIRGTEGVDGDHIDMFLSDHLDDWNGEVYVVDQIKTDGSFDEHKIMYGFNSIEEAQEAYLSNYSKGWKGLGAITGVSKDEFKKWIESSHRKTKPFAEYKTVKTTEGQGISQDDASEQKLREQLAIAERQRALESKVPKQKVLVDAYEQGDEQAIKAWEEQWESLLAMLTIDDMPLIDTTAKGAKEKKGVKLILTDKGYKVDKDSAIYKAYDYIEKTLKKRKKELEKSEKKSGSTNNKIDTTETVTGKRKNTATPQNTAVSEKKDSKTRVKPKKETENTQNIQDFGEKITGARKDLYNELAKSLNDATLESLIELPYAKVFKRPNTSKLVANGILRESDAKFVDAFITTYLSRSKPKAKKNDIRLEKSGLITPIKQWAQETYENITRLKDFLAASEQERDTIIEQLLAPETVEVTTEYMYFSNRTRKLINPLRVMMNVFDKLDYSPGDQYTFDKAFIEKKSNGEYSLCAHDGNNDYGYPRSVSQDVAEELIAWQARMKRGDKDINHPASLFYVRQENPITEGVGVYIVGYINRRGGVDTKEFNDKKAADEFAAKHQGNVYEKKETVGYKNAVVVFLNPLSKKETRLKLSTIYDSVDEAQMAITEDYNNINEEVNKRLELTGEKGTERKSDFVIVRVNYPTISYGVQYRGNLAEKIVIKDGFKTIEETRAWMDENLSKYEAELQKVRDKRKGFVFFNEKSNPRKGEDYRKGVDATPEMFAEMFGFRGVQFGNWTNQADRQAALNQAFDAFMDLSKIIGISPKAISLGGELGLAFGARGGGKAAAHYELTNVVINLTKTRGAGALAHEWWHALDNYFARQNNVPLGNATQLDSMPTMREELRKAFKVLTNAVKKTPYAKRSADQGAYWGGMHEMTARLFESWVDQKARKVGEYNTFLSGVPSEKEFELWRSINYGMYKLLLNDEQTPMSFEEFKNTPQALDGFPYPDAQETAELGEHLYDLFDTIEEKEEDGKTILFREKNDDKPVFYSNAEYAVKSIKQDKATPMQWVAMLKKNGGLKAGEDAWLGLEAWLNEQSGSVTKQQILDYINENSIQIEEVEYSEGSSGGYERLDAEILDLWRNADGNNYDKAEQVQDILNERYDGFSDAAEIWYDGSLRVKDEKALAKIIGEENPINSTRLNYTTRGLKNKREIALVVPTIESWNKNDEVHFGDAGDGRAVAWVRFGETTDAEGKRVLVIDEIQSKRHQEGRERGYKNPRVNKILDRIGDINSAMYSTGISVEMYEERNKLNAELETLLENENPVLKNIAEQLNEKKKRLTELHREKNLKEDEERVEIFKLQTKQNEVRNVKDYDYYESEINLLQGLINNRNEEIKTLKSDIDKLENEYEHYQRTEVRNASVGVDPAPFEKNWHELAMKRMLRYAAENGFDKVAWTTGEQQAERYSLGAVMEGLKAYKTSPNTYYVIPYNNGVIGEFVKEYSETELAETFGKEIAVNIITNAMDATEDHPYEITGDALRIGGSGMKTFYDSIIPSFMNKYTKKWGTKVGEVTMPSLRENNKMWSVDITPQMVESVMQGQLMFRTAKTAEEFDKIQKEAVEKQGIVVPGLNKTTVNIVDIPRHGFTGNLKEARTKAREWAIENYTGKEFDLPGNTGKYIISKNAIDKYLDKSAINKSVNAAVHLSAFKMLPTIIKNSVEAEVHADYAKDNNGVRSVDNGVNRDDLLVHRIYAAINNDGKIYRVKTTIYEFKNYNIANSPHSYEVTKIELIEDSTVIPNNGIDNPLNRSINSIDATKLLKGVEKSYDKGKKVLDESKKADNNNNAIATAATELANNLNTEIVIYNDVNEIKDSDKVTERRKRGSFGWYDIKANTVHVVLPNNDSIAEVQATILHEVVAHKGLRELLGEEKFKKLLNSVWNSLDKATQDKLYKQYGDELTAADEYIATIAEGNVTPTLFARVIGAIRRALREILGINIKMTDKDIAFMLWKSKNNLQKAKTVAQRIDINNRESKNAFRRKNAATEQMEEEMKNTDPNIVWDALDRYLNSHSIMEAIPVAKRKAFAEKSKQVLPKRVWDEIYNNYRNPDDMINRLAKILSGKKSEVRDTYTSVGYNVLVNWLPTFMNTEDLYKIVSRYKRDKKILTDKQMEEVQREPEKLQKRNTPYYIEPKKESAVKKVVKARIAEKQLENFKENGLVFNKYDIGAQIRQKLQDSTVAIDLYQNLVEKAFGITITPDTDIYNAINRWSSIAAAKGDKYNDEYLEPLIKTIGEVSEKYDVTFDEIVRYMTAESALERHQSGIMTMADKAEDNPEWNVELVRNYIQEMRGIVPAVELNKIWSLVNRANDFILDNIVDSGIKSAEEKAKIKGHKWKYYLPLMGWDMSAEENDNKDPMALYDFGEGPAHTGFSNRVNMQRAEGRITKPSNPISNMVDFAYKSIIAAENNRMKQVVLNQVNEMEQKNRVLADRVAKVQTRFYVKTSTGSWVEEPFGSEIPQEEIKTSNLARRKADALRRKLGDKKLTPEEKQSILEKINEYLANETVRVVYDNVVSGLLPLEDWRDSKKREVDVFVNGRKITIEFADPAVARAINFEMADPLSKFMRVAGKLSRVIAKVNTSLAPEFVMVNAVRDFKHTMQTQMVQGDMGTAVDTLRNYGGNMWSSAYRGLHSKEKKNPLTYNEMSGLDITRKEDRNKLIEQFGEDRVYDTLFEMFREGGGLTGFAFTRTADDIKKDIKRMSAKYTTVGKSRLNRKYVNPTVQGIKTVTDWATHVAEVAEAASRYSTFITSLDEGKDIRVAISDAKNITVNFNRKGEWTRQLGALYVFFNAAVQALAQQIKLFKDNPMRASVMFLLYHTTKGLLTEWIYQSIKSVLNDDDEEEDRAVSLYQRLNNTVFMFPNGAYIKIPKAQGFDKVFSGLGILLFDTFSGVMPANDAIKQFMALLGDSTLPVEMPKDGDFIRTVMPSFVEPLWNLRVNEDGLGYSIYQERYSEGTPSAQLGNRNTARPYVFIAETVNELFGGDEFHSMSMKDDGEVRQFMRRFLELNPASLQYLFEYFAGGTIYGGRFARHIWNTFIDAFKDNDGEFDVNELPIFSRFLGEAKVESPYSEFDRKFEALQNLHEINVRYQKQGNALTEEMIKNEVRYNVINNFNKQCSEIRKLLKAVSPTDEYFKELQREMRDVQRQANILDNTVDWESDNWESQLDIAIELIEQTK